MPTLSSALVKQGVASMSDVEKALARQALYGGDLVTNLLETAKVSEGALTRALAALHGLQPAGAGELPRSEESVLKLVPDDLSLRQGIYPLEERDGTLLLAVGEPLPPEVEEDLTFALGLRVEQLAAPLVRIRQAIARDYGHPLEQRLLRLLAKLEGRADPGPSAAPPAHPSGSPAVDLPGSARVPPLLYEPSVAIDVREVEGTVDAQPARGAVAAPGAPAAAAAQNFSANAAAPVPEHGTERLAGVSRPPSLHVPLRRGPYPPAAAEQDLASATSRDQVVRAFFDFASQYFEYAALFAVHADIAEGREARGPGADRRQIRSIGVPLDLPSSLQGVRQDGQWRLAKLAGTALDSGLAKDLRRSARQKVLLLPVVVRKRCVLILYGDYGDSDVELSQVGDVIAFAPLTARALERIILQRKRGALRAASKPSQPGLSAPRVPSVSMPLQPRASARDVPERAAALAHALEPSRPTKYGPGEEPFGQQDVGDQSQAAVPTQAEEQAPGRAPKSKPAQPSPAPQADATRLRSAAVTTSPTVPIDAAVAEPEDIHDAETRPAPEIEPRKLDSLAEAAADRRAFSHGAPMASVRRDSEPPESGWDPGDWAEVHAAQESVTSPGLGREVKTALAERFEAARTPAGPAAAAQESEQSVAAKEDWTAPELQVTGEADLSEDGIQLEDTDAPHISVGTASLDDGWAAEAERVEEAEHYAPSSRALAYPARAPQPAHESRRELALPTVIVDVASDCRALVDRLAAGDTRALPQLVEMGEPAIVALMQRFPGPITAEQEGQPGVSRQGPVLHALMRLGNASVPHLIERAAKGSDPDRVWAVRLLGEIPSVASAVAVANHLLAQDESLRHAALKASLQLGTDATARRTLCQTLGELATDRARSAQARLLAVSTLGRLLEPQSVPALQRLLEDPSEQIAHAASNALQLVTRQDFGRDTKRWRDWWRRNQAKHRVEWLIDALTHEQAKIRRAAGQELKSLSKEYFGYYDDLPRKERARAQKRYRHWWQTKGKTLFR